MLHKMHLDLELLEQENDNLKWKSSCITFTLNVPEFFCMSEDELLMLFTP